MPPYGEHKRPLIGVGGGETALAEIEPHPLHVNFEIHGYLCERCGPIKSLVVLKTPGAEALKLDHNSN